MNENIWSAFKNELGYVNATNQYVELSIRIPKSEDAKVPQCPPEKETAIKEALKHFGMI